MNTLQSNKINEKLSTTLWEMLIQGEISHNDDQKQEIHSIENIVLEDKKNDC